MTISECQFEMVYSNFEEVLKSEFTSKSVEIKKPVLEIETTQPGTCEQTINDETI